MATEQEVGEERSCLGTGSNFSTTQKYFVSCGYELSKKVLSDCNVKAKKTYFYFHGKAGNFNCGHFFNFEKQNYVLEILEVILFNTNIMEYLHIRPVYVNKKCLTVISRSLEVAYYKQSEWLIAVDAGFRPCAKESGYFNLCCRKKASPVSLKILQKTCNINALLIVGNDVNSNCKNIRKKLIQSILKRLKIISKTIAARVLFLILFTF